MTQAERTAQLGLDLGTLISGRMPHADEVFKAFDVELLPHTSSDTLLGELFSRSGRAYRSNSKNLIGYLYEHDLDAMDRVRERIRQQPRLDALMPNFEFTKEHILELNGSIPSLFNLSFNGRIESAKKLTVTVSNVKKSRLTNYEEPGRSIRNLLSAYAQEQAKSYRANIKKDYLAEALFYADSIVVELEKSAGQNLDVSFDLDATVEVTLENATSKRFKLSYAGAGCPFGAIMRKGKDFMD